MREIIFLLSMVAAALTACAPVDNRDVDITSGPICVDSHVGRYCKDLQGNYLRGVEVASEEPAR
jgi:hypothetical protein